MEMRRIPSLWLFGLFAPLILPVLADGLPRGVGPEFARFYADKDDFSCINHPEIKLSRDKVNDNTCHCPDGSDEPGTTACAYLDILSPPQPFNGPTATTNTTYTLPGFWCANEGHIGSYVPFMLLNDGHCDYDICCDGSEEYDHVGGVKCENRCVEVNKEHRLNESKRRDAIKKATKRYKGMMEESRELRNRVQAKVNSLEVECKSLQIRRDELEKRLDEVRRSENSKRVSGSQSSRKLDALQDLVRTRMTELRETLETVVAHREGLQTKVGELEAILSRFQKEYNPNFNDEGVKRAARSWEDYAAKLANEASATDLETNIRNALAVDSGTLGINWEEYEPSGPFFTLETYLPTTARGFLQKTFNSLHTWMTSLGFLADENVPGAESRLVIAARESLESADKDLEDKKRQLETERKELHKDYGENDVFRGLKNGCVAAEFGEYEYELCWMDTTKQKPRKGGAATNMGKFVRIDTEVADDDERSDGKSLGKGPRMVLRYEHGQACWNGPQRRTDVWLACSETEELWKVLEWEKCVYKMEVGTPAACGDMLEISPAEIKDEL